MRRNSVGILGLQAGVDVKNKQDLDRHITGNFGEDQFNSGRTLGRSFSAGVEARRSGTPLSSCRCRNPNNAAEWRYGWRDEDMAQLAFEQEGKL